MPRMTKTQIKNRLNEAKAKLKAVYLIEYSRWSVGAIITTSEMASLEKTINKCLKRLN